MFWLIFSQFSRSPLDDYEYELSVHSSIWLITCGSIQSQYLQLEYAGGSIVRRYLRIERFLLWVTIVEKRPSVSAIIARWNLSFL